MARYVPKSEALDNPARAAMMATVTAEPGITLTELAAAFHVTPSTVLWHARKLAAAGLLQMVRRGRHRLFYGAQGGSVARDQALRRDALRSARAQQALEAVRARPGLTAPGLAQRLDIGLHVARALLRSLAGVGLVQAATGGRALHYYARP